MTATSNQDTPILPDTPPVPDTPPLPDTPARPRAANLACLPNRTKYLFRSARAPLREMKEGLRQQTSATTLRATSTPPSPRRSLCHARRRTRIQDTTLIHPITDRRGTKMATEVAHLHFPHDDGSGLKL